MERRSFLRSSIAASSATTLAGIAAGQDASNKTEDFTTSCKYSSDNESKSTRNETCCRTLEMNSRAREEQGTRDNTYITGKADAENAAKFSKDARPDYMEMHVQVKTSSKIADAPARFEINGDTARYSKRRENDEDNWSLSISVNYGKVYGEAGSNFGCAPDMRQKIQTIAVDEYGNEMSKTHTLDPM